MKRPREDSQRWLRQAEHDLEMAKRLKEESPADSCYYAEQAAQTRYPDALADPAVPFESYSIQQASEAVQLSSEIVEAIKPKL